MTKYEQHSGNDFDGPLGRIGYNCIGNFRFSIATRVRCMANTELAAASTKPLLSGPALQRCINPLPATFDVGQVKTACDRCGDLLDVDYEWDQVPVPKRLSDFEKYWSRRYEPLRFSVVWRFHTNCCRSSSQNK